MRGNDEKYNPNRVRHIITESVTPTAMNPMANQIPNEYDPAGLAEINHNLRLLKNGLHIR